jgi:hypothetical protein
LLLLGLLQVLLTMLKTALSRVWAVKLVRRLTYLIGLFVLIAAAGHAKADYPATIEWGHTGANNQWHGSSTQLAACQHIAAENYPNKTNISVVPYLASAVECHSSPGGFFAYATRGYLCPPSTTPQAGATCIGEPPPTCTAGTVISSGYYSIGASPTTAFNNSPCMANGCGVRFEGTVPASRAIVNGKYVYYAKGAYITDGFQCTASTSDLPKTASGSLPAESCGTGQVSGTINGKFACVNQTDGKVANPNEAQTQATTTKNTVTNPDGSTTTTETTTKADGSTSTTVTNTASNGSSTTTTSSTAGTSDTPTTRTDGKTQAAKDTEDGVKEGMKAFCEENPESKMCKQEESGEAANSDDLYSPEEEQPSFEETISDFGQNMQSVGWYSMATNFFDVSNPSGSCGGMNQTIEFGGQTFTFNLDEIFCGSAADTIYSILGIGMQLAASFAAFSIAFLM